MEPISGNSSQVYIVTGATSGFGWILVYKLLTAGHSVVATTRNKVKLDQKVADYFKNDENVLKRYLGCQVDLADRQSIELCVKQTVQKFGRIDILINNAGYYLYGHVEDMSDKELRDNFDVNYFGPVNFVKLALPFLRESAKTNTTGSRVLNIASMAGVSGNEFMGMSSYVSTKFALEGFSDVLYSELKPLNIHVTSVKPGGFKTEILTEPSPCSAHYPSANYPHVSVANWDQQKVGLLNGDPVKLVDLLIKVCTNPNPPQHLVIGPDAYGLVNGKYKRVQDDMALLQAECTATNFDGIPAAATTN
ncbi:short-chain dehydrogenase/reductase family protein [Heterostelium album PN500]|uniref:Short-chain dehydrogenase/reductase family protein n=1 Tax=Heterostelium pallidum (strain ATCC 26659 / Pp 5 / PN500) TaxID=670386 RepID=D3BMH4_HETP5|nr:short-chain dehydrogenase/reductase family protein [Heterostelium album PN500]EFA77186.1 short-chain dehydrogenase/reductase family protein [Heterostelium album PN500]|eukprot:XP_020429315.1 short-chain dehydrogenase/reductase family protein [Heterostelium album PN500]